MNSNKEYYDVLAKIRELSHDRARDFITREAAQIEKFERCRDYLILGPESNSQGHNTHLAKLLLYKNLYRKLYLYLQGALLTEDYLNSPVDGTSSNHKWNLQEDDSFLKIQKELKLQMGLFAYADATENWTLRYLYGPHDLPQDSEKTFPHFYIKPFYCHEREDSTGQYEFRGVDKWGFSDHSKTLYYSRTNIHYRQLDFVQILEAHEGDPHWQRKTRFEKDMDIIYASDGEMGACTLAWLMFYIHQEHIKKLDSALSEKEPERVIQILREIKFQFLLKKRELTTTATPLKKEAEPLKPWNDEQSEENLLNWLIKLGLIKGEWDAVSYQVTERGKRLINWLALYLKSLGGEKLFILGNSEPAYHRIIRGVQPIKLDDLSMDNGSLFIQKIFESRSCEGTLPHEIYKRLSIDTKDEINSYIESRDDKPKEWLIKSILLIVNRILDGAVPLPWEKWVEQAIDAFGLSEQLKNIREPFCRRRLILQAHFPNCISEPKEFFPSWLDGINTNRIEDFIHAVTIPKGEIGLPELLQAVHLFILWQPRENGEEFSKRCRFNLLGHLTLRAGRQYLENIETASRAWLVFPVHHDYIDYQESSGVTGVGFFLGTFKDSTDQGHGYFEEFNTFGEELRARIVKIRQIMDLLAQVENREIYIKDIYNIQMQKAMDTQHKWTIHEICNEASGILGYVQRMKIKTIRENPEIIEKNYIELKEKCEEFEQILKWDDALMKGNRAEQDETWVSHEDLKHAYDRYARKLVMTADLENFFRAKDQTGKPLFETNYELVFDTNDKESQYKLPFYTYKKLINELAKNIIKYADRNKKCFFWLHMDDHFLTITIRNTYARNKTQMISTGKGLELFERFLKVYNEASNIDRQGLIHKQTGEECICKVKIAIEKRRIIKNEI